MDAGEDPSMGRPLDLFGQCFFLDFCELRGEYGSGWKHPRGVYRDEWYELLEDKDDQYKRD